MELLTMDTKSILTSKTIWANIVAVGATFAAKQFGVEIDASTQVAILGVVNLILRVVTKQPVAWS
jgi:hypothetical protein